MKQTLTLGFTQEDASRITSQYGIKRLFLAKPTLSRMSSLKSEKTIETLRTYRLKILMQSTMMKILRVEYLMRKMVNKMRKIHLKKLQRNLRKKVQRHVLPESV